MKPWTSSLLLAALLALPASPAAAQTRYLAFGDSITAGVGDDSTRTDPGYPSRLQALLVGAGLDAVVLNRGLGAERTPEGLLRLDSVLAEGGQVLLLMEGTNDITKNIGLETTRQNLNLMAQRAESRGMKVIMATLLPRIPNARVDGDNLLNQEQCELIRNAAGNRLRDLADPFEVFGSQPNRYGTLYWLDGNDGVGHPNAAGYDLMARIFFDVITGRDSVPPVTGIINPPSGSRGVNGGAPIEVDLWEFGAGIDRAATRLSVNGQQVDAVIEGDSRHLILTYQPTSALSGLVTLSLQSRDLATPANAVNRDIAWFLTFGTTFFDGDLDRSGRVDGEDLTTFARAFGARTGDRRFVEAADLTGNGEIDGEDLARLAANFGRTSS